MQLKPRLVDPRAVEIADLIDREIAARLGPDSTFEQRQEMAVAVMAEAIEQLQLAGPRGEG
jgi:hypothetical protein